MYLAIKKFFKGISEFKISFSPGNDQTQTYFYGIIPLKSAKEGTKDEVAALQLQEIGSVFVKGGTIFNEKTGAVF